MAVTGQYVSSTLRVHDVKITSSSCCPERRSVLKGPLGGYKMGGTIRLLRKATNTSNFRAAITVRILIVEDDSKSAGYLKKGLSENGFVADIAGDGEVALHVVGITHYELIILDIMLPKKDGWAVLASLHARDAQTPVICLTARDEIKDRVRGLESGADDYLTKPFAFSELLARVKTVLRRASNRPVETIQIGDLEIDLSRQKAVRAGQRLDLTPKEFLLLSCLARRAGDVVSRAAIAEEVWDMNFDCDTNVVDVHVRRLRSKVDDPFPEKLIQTIRGVGYVLRCTNG